MRTEDENLVILELGFGDFDEDDIVRLEDSYGREGTTPSELDGKKYPQ